MIRGYRKLPGSKQVYKLYRRPKKVFDLAKRKWHIGRKRMFKKIAIVSSWFVITPLTLVFLFILIVQGKQIDSLSQVTPVVTEEGYAQNNQIEGDVLGVEIQDIRHHYVENFLKGTKLEPYSGYMVEAADKNGIDYRLIPAIAMKESGGGDAINEATHNAWGFENGSTSWDTWEEAIDDVAQTLKERYVDKGLTTPDEIMPVYAPPQLSTGGKWAKDVNRFYEKLSSL